MSDGIVARRTAIEALIRIDRDGAYANLVTNHLLERSELDERDRRFVTELVYGTSRMRGACDHLIERFRSGELDHRTRAALRVGTYQLVFAQVAPHAALDATVSAAARPIRGLVNAVLRRVAAAHREGIEWPDLATELSYPEWIVDELGRVLGDRSPEALRAMNAPATTHVRADGYVQDLASQAVVAAADGRPGQRILDLCAAPGGKATGLAATGAVVVATDLRPARTALVVDNARRAGYELGVACADGTASPFADASFDTVLVDAPCSGLGVLRRRPDARWRVDAAAPERLAQVQRTLLTEARRLVRPEGTLLYSVCTLTQAEGDGVVDSGVVADADLIDRRVLVPDATSDGMYLARWRCG